MEHIDYTYTRGMDESAVEDRLRDVESGVLALAKDGESYAIPLVHYYDGEVLYFRLGYTEGSQKRAFVDATETATYLLYGAEPTDEFRELDSWSILATGELTELEGSARERFDTPEINRRFAPIRVFGESIDEIEIAILRLDIDRLTGRMTLTE